MWPVPGDELRKSLKTFLMTKLNLEPEFLADMGEVSLKRVPSGPGSKIENEVIAVFSTVEVRNVVRRAAKELEGDPNAGIRLEILAVSYTHLTLPTIYPV